MSAIDRSKFNVYDYVGNSSLALSEKGVVPNAGSAICITTQNTQYVLEATGNTVFSAIRMDEPGCSVAEVIDTYEEVSEPEDESPKIRAMFVGQSPVFTACISNLIIATSVFSESTDKPIHVDLWVPLQPKQLVSVSRKIDNISMPPTYLDGKLDSALLVVTRNQH